VSRAAVFLDRDGVLVEDNGRFDCAPARLLGGVAAALDHLSHAGFELVVVSNQPVIARGLASEADVVRCNDAIRALIESEGGPSIKHFYFCPHHPNATLAPYRIECDCRKPEPGLLRRAAKDHAIDLESSFLVGDRITDIIAGQRAGCRSVLVQTGRHLDPPIETSTPIDPATRPDHVCADLPAAVAWILSR
jgi:D-glycero-D-manno-heptose 1,7-bisphosphate phosphatase